MPEGQSLVPEITDEDIDWVIDLMGLKDLDEPRRAFLTSCSTLDVSACPGSGKTTLVVGKLAIMARKWPHRTKGICVLSHTNAAREEIQQRLGGTVVGQRLLEYPHYIDTIHGFVNRFLALPWLNSNGFPSPTVDNDVTTEYRRGVIGRDYWTVQNVLSRRHSDFDRLRIHDRNLSFGHGGKAFPYGPNTPSFQHAKRAVETAAKAGYFCYDEMFVWARALLEDFPRVSSWLRCRFPLIILDEMQDTFELQGAMLHSVFPRTSTDIVVQRVGDPNQAIFDNLDAKSDTSAPFPDPDSARCLEIPNSYRFGSELAALASPFAVAPVGTAGLCGVGPKASITSPSLTENAIFIFPDDSTEGVLSAYGKHVLTVLDDATLAGGLVTAVGAVHRDAQDIEPGDKHFPKSVPHYWEGYKAEIARKDPNPRTLVQYFRVAQAAVRDCRELSPGVEKIATGLIRLAGRIGDTSHLQSRARNHRALVSALEVFPEELKVYRRLITVVLIDWIPVTEENWLGIKADFLAIACALCDGETVPSNATGFLAWSEGDLSLAVEASTSPDDAGPNVSRVVEDDRMVDIRLGSIHSVKGQTHLATMILNTYWHAHSSKQLLPWLLAEKVNGKGAGVQDVKRLLQTYVAMTRPSYMVCFAIPRFVLGDDIAVAKSVASLIAGGWRVAEIVDGESIWQT